MYALQLSEPVYGCLTCEYHNLQSYHISVFHKKAERVYDYTPWLDIKQQRTTVTERPAICTNSCPLCWGLDPNPNHFSCGGVMSGRQSRATAGTSQLALDA